MAQSATDDKLIKTKPLTAGWVRLVVSQLQSCYFSFAHVKVVIKFQVHLPFWEHILQILHVATKNKLEFREGDA